MKARIVALGHRFAADDAAALRVGERLAAEGAEVVLAGRPGVGLLDLLDRPTVLLDVVRRGARPGELLEIPLSALANASLCEWSVSSHDLGVATTLELGAALGRRLPPGTFLGVGGARFDPSDTLSPEVERALDAFTRAAREALARWEPPCTSTD